MVFMSKVLDKKENQVLVRHNAREQVFLLIFERISLGERNEFSLENYLATAESQADYIKNIYDLVDSRFEFLTKHIDKYSVGFKLDRLFKVDLSVLLLAMVEILFVDSVPDLVAVNEALELVKKYSSEKSQKFIHGILGKIVGDKDRLIDLFKNPKKEEEENQITNDSLQSNNEDLPQENKEGVKQGKRVWKAVTGTDA